MCCKECQKLKLESLGEHLGWKSESWGWHLRWKAKHVGEPRKCFSRARNVVILEGGWSEGYREDGTVKWRR